MEQLAAMIGIMANQGIKGEQAGTSLRGAMLRLVNPPKAAAAALKELHVKVTDSTGKFRSFSDIIGDLNKSTANMTNAQKTATLAHIFGTNAVSGMLAVISGGKDKVDKFTDALKNSDGASAKAAKQMQDNFAGSLKKLNGALDAAKIGIEQALAPALRKIADIIQKVVVAFNNLSPGMKQFIAVSLAVIAVVATIGATLGLFLSGIGAVISAFGAISVAIAEAGGAVAIFESILAVITGPIGIAVAAIVGLVAIFIALWKNNETFRGKVIEIWNAIQNAFKVSLNFIMNIVHKVMTDVMSFVGSILGKLQAFWSSHGSQIKTIVSAVLVLFGHIYRM
jgi:phage-related protein